MTRRVTLRTSDADRERVAEGLRHAAAEGRLLADELEARLALLWLAIGWRFLAHRHESVR